METLERKDANPVPEEPIKSEEMVPSPSTSDRSNIAGSPPPHCSICLGKLVNTSFTDSCLHQFCFNCLLQWSKIKTECPLCKQTFKSIIHNVRSEGDYDQYDVNCQPVAAALDVAVGFSAQPWDVIRRSHGVSPLSIPSRSFMYRTTMGSYHRRFNTLLNAEAVARREQVPSHIREVTREDIRRRGLDPYEFRREIYRQQLRAADLPDAFGRFREYSAEYYMRHPGETRRLVPWLNRELQVLLNDNCSHIAYVMNVIMDTITRYNIDSTSFLNIVQPYFGSKAEHFVHEFLNYARSNYDMVGYDQSVIYPRNMVGGLSDDYATGTVSPISTSTSDSDSDSDVRLIDDDRDHMLGMHAVYFDRNIIDIPGPSSVERAIQMTFPGLPDGPQVPPVIYTISSSSESENECEFIGYVKPRHERTPEVIDLDSSEDEAIIPGPSTSTENSRPEVPLTVVEEVVPGPSIVRNLNISRRTRQFDDDGSRCCMYECFSSVSEPGTDESDSDYNPQSKSRRRKKKSSKNSSRKARTLKHKKTTNVVRKRDKLHMDSEVESETMDMPSTSRGSKRCISDHSDSEILSKPSKKSKKTTSPIKSKKSKPVYRPMCNDYDSDSTSTMSCTDNSDREYSDYYSKEMSPTPWYNEIDHSPSQPQLAKNGGLSGEDDNDGDDDDDEYLNKKLKSVVAAASVHDRHSSEFEHSSSIKSSRGRYRSHKKRKESKKRRRSCS
ncbi:E3 ubiquitin-protein ligase Topors-like [Phymastichus coffea]|uniref:E3 ubiquitin-protein ligase Topors-like n=1 Tax=Phymastichus coffea TaxID=108790 RepID=UPI00273CB5B3|nr:E3 ubiquitin-protein ligase Topors-like [Phymastichus coffea]